MTRQIKVGRWLDCGCCGMGFQVWKGYEDQDQDAGYGLCKRCQGINEEAEQKERDKLVACLRDGLNPTNRAKFDAMSKEEQELLATQALDEGHIKYTIRRS